MSNTRFGARKTGGPEFIISSCSDRFYPLITSTHPEAREFLREIPLSNINWASLEVLADLESPTTELEALLIPTNCARTISVVVGTNEVGTLPDSAVVSQSQIARVYASGFIPTCTLLFTPGDSIIARVFLFKTDGGVPFNDPPPTDWALLPAGSLWRVEPTRISPFADIPDHSQVLLELRPSGDLIYVFLDGMECGILDMEAADALAGAVGAAIEDGYVPVVHGCVGHEDDGHVSLHIDALAFGLWQPADFSLSANPRATLIPHQPDPRQYLDGLIEFVRAHEPMRDPVLERRLALMNWFRKFSPAILIVMGIVSIAIAVIVDGISARGTVGIFGFSFVFIFLGVWVLACRRGDTPRKKQSRHWIFLIPLTVSALIPSVVFANIGIFYDPYSPLSSPSSVEMTTLRTFPVLRDNETPGPSAVITSAPLVSTEADVPAQQDRSVNPGQVGMTREAEPTPGNTEPGDSDDVSTDPVESAEPTPPDIP